MSTTLNGSPVHHGRLTLPLVGAWHAMIDCGTSTAPTGAGTLAIGGTNYVGTCIRSGVWSGTARLLLVPGNGALATDMAPAASYRNAPASLVLSRALTALGLTTSYSATGTLPFYVRHEQPWSTALPSLMAAILPSGWTWRIGPDGVLSAQLESWPDATVSADDAIAEIDAPDLGCVFVSMRAPAVRPGQQWGGRRVNRVEIDLGAERQKSLIYYERT